MGPSEDGDRVGAGVDCVVGTIVWVRRRNGSWWPGRILGPEELSVSHLMSPRSGTPVKLLGREDASVDWYNLEKSKRVKAFRCGEFDACIEKAEASLGVPIKKREKYARREDAILHALELERKQLEMTQQKQPTISGGPTGNSLGILKNDFKNLSSLDTVTRNVVSSMPSKYSIDKPPALPTKPVLLDEEEKLKSSINVNEGKNCVQTGWEEDVSGAIHRVRGLKDFGLRIAPKKKLPPSVAWPTKESAENNMDALPSAGHTVRSRGHANSGNDALSIKIKKSNGGLVEESLGKKRDRRRRLLQVLQSSAKLQSSQLNHYSGFTPMHGEMDHMGVIHRAKRSRCIYLPSDPIDSRDDGGNSSDDMETPENQFGLGNSLNQPDSLVADCTTSGMIETNESDSSLRNCLEDETEGDILEDTGQFVTSRPTDHDSSASHLSEKSGDMDNDEVPFSGFMSHLHAHEHSADASADVGISKWHMKGKRNIRNLVKRPVDARDDNSHVAGSDKFDVSARGTAYGTKCSTVKMENVEPMVPMNVEQGFLHIKREENHAYEEVDLIDENFFQEDMNGYNNHRYPSIPKPARDIGRIHSGFNNLESDSQLISMSWEADGRSHGPRRKCLEESDECYDPVYASYVSREMGVNYFDINLKVNASYQGERVPLVSLMSRLNGKAIIGHPVQIEILEDGSTSQYFPSNFSGPDESTAHQPVWRTARRTALQRVPRSNPLTSSLEDDEAEGSQHPGRENRPTPDVYFGPSRNQSRLTKKRVFSALRSPLGNFQKSQKRVNLSSQKTRTLSSFSSEQKLDPENGKASLARGSDLLGGLMKPEVQVPLVTCVPVKLAFSRLLEAVGRT